MFFHLGHLIWLISASGGAGIAGRYIQLRVRQAHRIIPPDPSTELLRLHELYGYNAHSLVGIASGARLWSCQETEGAVAFNDFGKVWLVPGEPLASPDSQATLAHRFLQAASAAGRTVGFLPVKQWLWIRIALYVATRVLGFPNVLEMSQVFAHSNER